MKVQIILAIEDPLLRNLLADRLLQETDFEIVGAVGHADSLLDVVLLTKPQVIVFDLMWSTASGFTLMDQVLLQIPGAMFLALAPEEAEEAQVQAAQNGARGVVTKSEGIAVLPQAIRALGRGEVWFTRQVSRRIFQDYHRLLREQRAKEHPLASLSEREREVLAQVALGLTNQQIADELHMSVHTAKLHVQNILKKLDKSNRTEIAAIAIREGLVGHPQNRLTKA